MKKKEETSTCNQCHKTMKWSVGVHNTNIAFLGLNNEKQYQNDDRLVGICTSFSLAFYLWEFI